MGRISQRVGWVVRRPNREEVPTKVCFAALAAVSVSSTKADRDVQVRDTEEPRQRLAATTPQRRGEIRVTVQDRALVLKLHGSFSSVRMQWI